MKIVLINHTHPNATHVSALRMREFAACLASAGDRVVLITGPLDPYSAVEAPAALDAQIAAHNWSSPFHVTCRHYTTPLRQAAREGRIVPPFRQVVIGASYLLRGGLFGDWRTGASKILPFIATRFCPDVVLATFGNTDAWSIAQELAQVARCPWVADYKDPWSCFLPLGFRRTMAARYADMAGMTTFSRAHARDADAWFPCVKEVVYSGYRSNPETELLEGEHKNLQITLSGSIYDGRSVQLLLEGLALLSEEGNIKLIYAGNDGGRIGEMITRASSRVTFEDYGYLDIDSLTRLQRNAAVNIYVRNPNSLFQQKLIELMAIGRPVISVPGESEEARELSEHIGGTLIPASTPAEIASVFSELRSTQVGVDLERLRVYSWSAQTARLQRFLSSVV